MKLYDSPQVAQRPIDGRTAMISPGIVPENSLAPGLAAVAQQVTAEAERVSKLRIEDAANKISAVYAAHAEEASKLQGESAFIERNQDDNGLPREGVNPMDKFKEKARADADKILSEAGTQAQRDAIQKIILDHDGRLNLALMKHQDKELVRYGDSVKSATYGRSIDAALAAAASGDQAGFKSNFDAAAEAFKGVSTNQGLDLTEELRSRQSKAALEAVTNMVKSKVPVGGVNGPNAYLFAAMKSDDLADAKKLTEAHDTKNETLKMAEDTFYKGITAEEVRAAAQVFYPDDADKNKAYVDHMHDRMRDVVIDQEKVDKDRNGEVIAEATKTKSATVINNLITVVDTDMTMSKAQRGHTTAALRHLLNGIKDGPDAQLALRVQAARWMSEPGFGDEVRKDPQAAITKAATFGVHNFDYAMQGVNAAKVPNTTEAPAAARELAKHAISRGKKMSDDEEKAFSAAVVTVNVEHSMLFQNSGKGGAAAKPWTQQEWADKIVNEAKKRPAGFFSSKTSLSAARVSDSPKNEYDKILGEMAGDERKLAETTLRDFGVQNPTALQIIHQVDEDRLWKRNNPDEYSVAYNLANPKTTLPNGRAGSDKPAAKPAAAPAPTAAAAPLMSTEERYRRQKAVDAKAAAAKENK